MLYPISCVWLLSEVQDQVQKENLAFAGRDLLLYSESQMFKSLFGRLSVLTGRSQEPEHPVPPRQ